MRLLLSVSTEVLLDCPIRRLIAESTEGHFCVLPRHVDLVTVLVPGLLSYVREDGNEAVVAVDHGVLVKVGDEIRVACERAQSASDPETAARAVREHFDVQSEREKRARATLARLEVDMVRRLGALRGRHGA